MFKALATMFAGRNDLSAPEAAAAVQGGAPVVDVREPVEFASGAIPGAINIPLSRIQAQGPEALLRAGVDVTSPRIVFCCRSGARSGSACRILRAALGDRARNLGGGMLAWSREGLPVAPNGKAH